MCQEVHVPGSAELRTQLLRVELASPVNYYGCMQHIMHVPYVCSTRCAGMMVRRLRHWVDHEGLGVNMCHMPLDAPYCACAVMRFLARELAQASPLIPDAA